MTIHFTCAECGSALKIKDDLAGTNGQCPKCKTAFVVPAVSADASKLEEAKPVAAGVGDPQRAGVLGTAAKPSVDDDLDSLPRFVMPNEDADQLDSPPRLVIPRSSQGAADDGHQPAAPAKKTAAKPATPRRKSDEPFDPVAFLTSDAPDERRGPAIPRDLDGELDLDREEVNPLTKPDPTMPKSESSSRKEGLTDHAKAAKQLRKAIKQSRVEEARLREQEQKEGFDYSGAFREVGLKGGGALLAVLALIFGVNLFINHLMGGGLTLPPLGKVSGIVTLDDQPLEGVTVYFEPQATDEVGKKRERARTSIGITDAKGQYNMVYIEGVKGVAVGKCRMWINFAQPQGRPQIPPEYSEASLTTREVIAGSQTMNFSMKSRR